MQIDYNKITNYVLTVLIGIITFIVVSKWLTNTTNSELTGVKVVLTAKVLKDDVFQLFYWVQSEEKFKIENSVRTNVKGNKEFQEIAFELPDLIDLYRLSLDIGENKNQQKVTIDKIEFSSNLGDNELYVKEFNRLFTPNKYVKTEAENSYMGVVGTNAGRTFYDPYFISNDDSKEMSMIRSNKVSAFPYLTAILVSVLLMLFLVKNQRKIALSWKGVFAPIFLLVLVSPILQKNLNLAEEYKNLEKRKLTEKPDFSFSKSFVKDFETYFDDNFGFRNRLVDWGGTIKTKIFKSSVYPEKVMLGKNKWLFYNHFKNKIFDSYRNENLLTNDTLELLVNQWERNKKTYAAQGKKYFLVFWPNKHTIYPEFLPTSMAVQIKDTVSRVDQIISYIDKKKSNIRLVDVRSKLNDKKKEFQLYHKFDTHWNEYGAFLGYQSFFEQIQDDLEILPKTKDDFKVDWTFYRDGDLIPMLGIRNNGFFEEKKPKFTIRENKDQIEYLPVDGYPKLTIRTRNKLAENELKALVFMDSYTKNLVQFFSLHFFEVTYIRGHQEDFVSIVKPDVIIDGFVEREIGEKHTIDKL